MYVFTSFNLTPFPFIPLSSLFQLPKKKKKPERKGKKKKRAKENSIISCIRSIAKNSVFGPHSSFFYFQKIKITIALIDDTILYMYALKCDLYSRKYI